MSRLSRSIPVVCGYDSSGRKTRTSTVAGRPFTGSRSFDMCVRPLLTGVSDTFHGPYARACAWDADGQDFWFDDEDRLVSVFDESAYTETFSRYDHLHRRVARHSLTWSPDGALCVTNGSRTFAWDGWSVVREWRGSPGVPATAVDYYWGTDLSGTLQGAGGVGGLLAVSANGAFYLPLCDANGNITAYVSESGDMVATYEYDAFGNTVSQSGALADTFAFRFSTKYWDAEAGLYYYGRRYLKPSWGRWISRDPIGEDGGANLYAFCGNNAVNRFDILGMFQLSASIRQSIYDFIVNNANLQGNVSRKLLHHYMFDNGNEFVLTHQDIIELNPYADLMSNRHFESDVRFYKMIKRFQFQGNYTLQAATDVSGSLGSFGLKTTMKVIICPFRIKKKNVFSAYGIAELFDRWDFDWNLWNNLAAAFTGEFSRSFMGQLRTMAGSAIPGTPFPIKSVNFIVHQNPSESFLRYE